MTDMEASEIGDLLRGRIGLIIGPGLTSSPSLIVDLSEELRREFGGSGDGTCFHVAERAIKASEDESRVREFVRDFLGRTVLLKGTPRHVRGGEAQVLLDGEHRTVLSANCPLPGGTRCVVALRPEDIVIRPRSNPAPPTAATLAGLVMDVRFIGKRVEYRVDVDGQGTLEVRGDRHEVLGRGQPVWLELNPNGATFWPAS